MTTIEVRNEQFSSLKAKLPALRRQVLAAWVSHGPGTTRAVASRAGIDLLSFRPRSTELYQLGLLRLDESQPVSGEGVYRVRSESEWTAWRAAAFPLSTQLQLGGALSHA